MTCNPSARYDGDHRSTTDAILGAFYQVDNELGTGFLESVYEAAMSIVLGTTGLAAERQAPLSVHFRGAVIGIFKIDLLVDSSVAVELKASNAPDPAHTAQLLNYLRASDLEAGLLLNFGQRLEFRRMVYSNERKRARRAAADQEQEQEQQQQQSGRR